MTHATARSARRLFVTLAAGAIILSGGSVGAHNYKVGAIDIGHPYARATLSGQSVGGGFLKLSNGGAADKLVSARTAAAERVEMHTMRMDGDVMRMRQLEAIELPAGQTVDLKPGGFHLMLMGLKAPLKAGDTFPLVLKFEKAGEVTVDIKVEAPGAAKADVHQH